uniref:Uncharacterized protein n=1 Tax=Echeneis naucrates TaxID=173247 RepID=A0A665XAK0_ECHNA
MRCETVRCLVCLHLLTCTTFGKFHISPRGLTEADSVRSTTSTCLLPFKNCCMKK